MKLPNDPGGETGEDIDFRQGYLNDLMHYIGEAGIFDSDERDIHQIVQMSLLTISLSDLEELLRIAKGDIDAFRESFQKVMRTTRETRARIRNFTTIIQNT